MLCTLYHVTHKNNVRSILKHGLLLKKATNQKRPFVWFDLEPSHELRQHIAKKHGWAVSDMVTLEVTLPAHKLIRHPLNIAVWGEARKVKFDVNPNRIKVLSRAEEGWL